MRGAHRHGDCRTRERPYLIDRITLPGGAQFSYAYDGLMRLVRTIDPAGGVWTREYDAASTLTALIDPTGVSVRTSVDSSRKTITTNDGVDRVRISCDHLGRPVRTEVLSEDPGPQVSADVDDPTVSTMVYDGAGNPVEVLDAEGGLSRYEYNGSNQMVRMISPAGRVTEYRYDACGRLAATYEAAGTAEQSVTRYEYDADSRLIRQVYGDGSEARVRYDACGRVLSITGSGVASPVFYTWDSCGRVKSIRDNKWGTRSFTYDAASQVVAVTNGAGGVTHYRYDEAGNVTSVMDPAGRITSYEYDLMGNVLAVTNPLGVRTTSTYDAAGRLLTSTDGNGAVHSFGYDRDGVPCSHSVNGSLLYRMERDSARRTMTTYDHAGVDAFGAPVVTVESYDRLGRLVRQRREFGAQIPESFRTEYMDETGGYELSYAYDADGLRTEFVHPLGSSVYAYDAAGRMVKQTDITAYRLDGTAVTSESRVESSFEYNAVDALVRAQVSDLAGTWVREFGYRGAHMTSVTEQPAVADSAVADSSEALHTEIIRDDLGRISGVDSPAGLVMYTYTDAQMLSSAVRGTETLRWTYDAAGALVRVEYFDSAQPQNAWAKVLVTDEGARVRAVCLYGVQDEAKTDSQSAEFASAVEDAQAWLGQCPESVELEGVTLVPVATSVFSYDGNDSRLLQVSSDGSGSSLTYGAAGYVNSVASWGSAGDPAVAFSLLCASTDGRVLAAGGASAGVPEFGVLSTDARANAGFDASVMHPLVWDENSFVPRVLGVGGSSMPSVGSLVPGAGSGAGLLDPYGWASLGVVAPAVPSAQGAGAAPVLPDSLVGVSAASGVVLGSSGFEVLGARVVDSRVARFTAPDPLAAPVGAGWGADRFSLVGGNPVLLVDPWGLSPVSVEDFEKYRESCADRGVNGWLNRHSEGIQTVLTVVGVIASVAGFFALGPVALIVAGVVAGASFAAATSISNNRDENGRVNWGRVGIDAAIGGAFGAIGGGIAVKGRGVMVALGRTKAVGALEQAITGGWSKGAQVFATRASVNAIPEVAAGFVGGFENLAHDAVNGKIGDKGQYSIREHVVSTLSGGIFGGLSSAPRALSGSLAKKAQPMTQKMYDTARLVKNNYLAPSVTKLDNEKVTRAFNVVSEGLSKLKPRPVAQFASDVLTPAFLKTSQSLVDTWGRNGEITMSDLLWSGGKGLIGGGLGAVKYHEGSSVKDPRTIAQLGMSHDTSMSRIAYVRDPEKNKARLEQKMKDLDKTMLGIGRGKVVSKGLDEMQDTHSYIEKQPGDFESKYEKPISEIIVGYKDSKVKK